MWKIMILAICVFVSLGCVLGGDEDAEKIWSEIKATGGRVK
jgi:hypothetical protein